MRKLVSVLTLLCFLLSNLSFAIDTHPSTAPKGNIILAAPVQPDDMLDKDRKPLAIAKMGLFMDLALMSSLPRSIDNTTDYLTIIFSCAYARHNTLHCGCSGFEPDRVQTC